MEEDSDNDLELMEELACERTILAAKKLDPGIDIDEILEEKAKKSQLNPRNVKLLIKNILTNDDVVTMLRQTLDENMEGNCLYEPKLTRGKIKEMISSSSYDPTSINQWSPKQPQSIVSECRSLIDNDFPDDSDDEEYEPELQMEDDYDDDYDDIIKFTTMEPSETENVNNYELEDDQNACIDEEETIGMRTRSKFSLNDTPLETIEQAFIPPDITEDMYDSACENDEWMEFLSEFTKPLEPNQNDDVEDDPEYNVLGDVDFLNVDEEEFRKDKSVKISRKEYNELMNELNEYTENCFNFNGIEEYEENDTAVAECDETTIVKSRNSSPLNMDYSNNLECGSNNITYTNYKNSIDAENVKPLYSLNIVDCGPGEVGFTDKKNVYKPPKCNSLSFYTSNYSDWKSYLIDSPDNEKSVGIDDQKTEGDYSKQITDSPLNAHQTIVNEQLVNSKFVVYNLPSNIQSTKKVTKPTDSDSQNTTVCSQTSGMSSKQTILLKQQLTQHVQLLIQSYLLCSMTRRFKMYCPKIISMLDLIKEVSTDEKFEPINIHSSIKCIEEWQKVQKYKLYSDKDRDEIPTNVKEFMLFFDKPLFIYPELLPIRTFHNHIRTFPIGESEERFMILKIDYVYNSLKLSNTTKAKYRKQNIIDMLPVILKTVHKRWFSFRKLSDIKSFVVRRRNKSSMSLMKNYLLHGEIDDTIHMVDIGPVFIGRCLYECDIDMFPCSWKALIKHSMLKTYAKK